MIDFQNAKSIVIPEGEVSIIARGDEILWQKHTGPVYTELEYIESTGTQWIDTGVNKIMFTNQDKISVGFRPTNVSAAAYLFGVMIGSRGCAVRTRSATWIQASIWQGGGPSASNVDTVYKKFDIELSKAEGFVLDGVFQSAAGNGNMTLTTLPYFPLCIGAYVEASGSGATTYTVTPKPGRYYYLRVEQQGVLIRDMIPVLDANDTPCMYDKVSGEFFYNNGTGKFAYA